MFALGILVSWVVLHRRKVTPSPRDAGSPPPVEPHHTGAELGGKPAASQELGSVPVMEMDAAVVELDGTPRRPVEILGEKTGLVQQ